jgi:hypothetical protein
LAASLTDFQSLPLLDVVSVLDAAACGRHPNSRVVVGQMGMVEFSGILCALLCLTIILVLGNYWCAISSVEEILPSWHDLTGRKMEASENHVSFQ